MIKRLITIIMLTPMMAFSHSSRELGSGSLSEFVFEVVMVGNGEAVVSSNGERERYNNYILVLCIEDIILAFVGNM